MGLGGNHDDRNISARTNSIINTTIFPDSKGWRHCFNDDWSGTRTCKLSGAFSLLQSRILPHRLFRSPLVGYDPQPSGNPGEESQEFEGDPLADYEDPVRMDEGHLCESLGWGIEEGDTHDAELHEDFVHVQLTQHGRTAA